MQTDLLGKALEPIIQETVREELKTLNVEEQVKASLTGIVQSASKTLTVKLGQDGEPIKMGLVHKQFETLLQTISCGENLLLMGGAGRGKTTAIVKIAEALGLGFRSTSFNSQTTKSDLVGFMDAMGIYRKSPLIEAMENGDIWLADEFDAGNDTSIMAINSLIENRFIDIQGVGVIHAHENFRVVASANTNLRGATSQYSARRKLDDATIDRFSVLEWELDEELEKLITANDDWLKIVRKVRKDCENKLDGLEITPRASYKGAKLLKTELPLDVIIGMVLHKGLDEDSKNVIDNAISKCNAEYERLNNRHAKSGEPEPEKDKVLEPVTEEEPKPEPEPQPEPETEPETEPAYDW